jgi:hypothetical protein
MKQLMFLLIVGLLSQSISEAVEPNRKSLNDVSFNLRGLQPEQTHKYKWMSLTQKGAKRESKDYGVLVIFTKLEKDNLLLHDTITLVPAYNGMVFERRIKYPKDSLLRPDEITLDISASGKTVREMICQNGEMKIEGKAEPEHPRFDKGILTFNAFLRLAPLLPRDIGNVYTFQMYAEPFLFRIREAEEKNDSFTIACEALETVKIGKKSYKCVRFRMDLKSAVIRTDVWVGENNLVVKFVDTLPEGAEAEALEATLQE